MFKLKPSADEKETSKKQLLLAARRCFAKKGLEGTTVRDIAREAKASLCLVSYHFGGKEGLYRACISEFGKARLEIAESLLEKATSPEDFKVRLKLVLESIAKSIIEEPEAHKILGREIEAGLPLAKDVFEETFLKLTRKLTEFFKDAQKNGFLRTELDPYCLTTLIHGTMGQWLRVEPIHKKYFDRSIYDSKQREAYLESLLSIILNGSLVKVV